MKSFCSLSFMTYCSEKDLPFITKIKNMKRPSYVTDKALKTFIKNALEEVNMTGIKFERKDTLFLRGDD